VGLAVREEMDKEEGIIQQRHIDMWEGLPPLVVHVGKTTQQNTARSMAKHKQLEFTVGQPNISEFYRCRRGKRFIYALQQHPLNGSLNLEDTD
jgi:hypothetical protein